MMIGTKLERAFNAYVEIVGAEKARADLERATGTRFLAAIPDNKIPHAFAVMIGGGLSLELGKPKTAQPERLAATQRCLAGMAASIYGER